MGDNEGACEGLNEGDAVTTAGVGEMVGVTVGLVLLATCKLCVDRCMLDNDEDEDDDGCACSTRLCYEGTY